ncbi:MAG: hypothetical protein WAV84_01015 [Bacteroidota bacterium]
MKGEKLKVKGEKHRSRFPLPRSLFFLPFYLSLFTFHLYSQTIYEPLGSPIYSYLDRLEARYGYSLLQFTRPLPRMEIAKVVDSLSRSSVALMRYDREELAWYRSEFAEEIVRLARAGGASEKPDDERWNLVRARGESPAQGFIAADIVASGGYTLRDGAENVFRRGFGISAMGYASEYLGASLRWYDSGVRGLVYDPVAARVPEQGIVRGPAKGTTRYDFEVAEGQFTLSLPWLRFGAQKMDLAWGSEREGNIILSRKVPSFPAVSLQVLLTDWLQFDYFHAWLFSDELDVVVSFQPPEGTADQYQVFANKYLSAHAITARIHPNLQIALGETMVYSGGPVNLLFLIPVMPFRAADRWTRATTGNAQIFADIRYSPIQRLTLYGTGYIDELDYSKILAADKTKFDYHVAYSVGAMAADLSTALIPFASETRLEFSRVYPYAYTNPKPIQRYTSHNVIMGHWIGPNADVVTLSHTVHPDRGWDVTGRLSYARFGQVDMFLEEGDRIQPAFLYNHDYSRLTIHGALRFRPLHGLSLNLFGEYVKNSEGTDFTGSPVPEGLSLGGIFSYGLE